MGDGRSTRSLALAAGGCGGRGGSPWSSPCPATSTPSRWRPCLRPVMSSPSTNGRRVNRRQKGRPSRFAAVPSHHVTAACVLIVISVHISGLLLLLLLSTIILIVIINISILLLVIIIIVILLLAIISSSILILILISISILIITTSNVVFNIVMIVSATIFA